MSNFWFLRECYGNLQNTISTFSILGHSETWLSSDWSKL